MSSISPCIVVSVSGAPKTGKSHFSLSFPEPILVYSFDLRGVELILPHVKAKDVTVRKFVLPLIETVHPEKGDKEFVNYMASFEAQFKKDMGLEGKSEKDFKTVVFDPATTLWEAVRLSFEAAQGHELGKARNYGEPNSKMTFFLLQPAYLGKNVVAINYLREKYLNDSPTGEMIPDGFRATIGLADVAFISERRGKKEKTEFYFTITDCRFDPKLTGYELPANSGYKDLMLTLGFASG